MLSKTLLFAIIISGFSLDIVMRHDVDESEYIALAEKYAGSSIRLNAGCGTFVLPNVILTAAHVAIVPQMGDDVTVDGVKYKISEIIIHPEYEDGRSLANDIAIIILEEGVPNIELAKLYYNNDEVGKEIIFAGTGWAGTGDKGMVEGSINKDRKMRAAQNRVDGIREDGFIRFTFDAPDSEDALPLEGISGPGDSGGPALWFDGDQAYILGVSSHQDGRGMGKPEGVYNVHEFYTRVSEFTDWIETELKNNDIDLN
ncbi:MAG: trypsin-like serine protease [Balneola sp.]|nr:trypsin-like serine protease [Balneola sp.]MBO6651427.1 trypsin-like serine protease [Balneola sp.]MBO6712536.1 trypsin-like serine protease [Balneola sp.]MBO6800971.1 trypsin-like serine protease [Balneola sp.]MBO6870643.1 trypsin-like serine protease [Balneola sp.]